MSTITSGSPHSGHHPGTYIVAGLLFLLMFLIVFVSQIQTNEVFIMHTGVVNMFHPEWGILIQPIQLIFGGLPADEAQGAIFGWGIEVIFLGFMFGYEIMHHATKRSGQIMSIIFIILSWFVVGLNGFIDYNYGTLGSGWIGHLGFAVMCSFIIGFFCIIGIAFIEHGWKHA